MSVWSEVKLGVFERLRWAAMGAIVGFLYGLLAHELVVMAYRWLMH